MSPHAELDHVLAASPSPFSDSVLPNAFRDTPDVPGIHGEARDRLLALLDLCRSDRKTAMQVVTGDPGEGKTHLLAWLRRAADDSWSNSARCPAALAPIEPLRSVDRVFHHMLRETVRHLRRPLGSQVPGDSGVESPIDRMLWRVLLRAIRQLIGAPWVDPRLSAQLSGLVQHHPERFLSAFAELASAVWPAIENDLHAAASRLPDLATIDPDILRVLFRFPMPSLRLDVLAWLGGACLPDDRLAQLGTKLSLDDEESAWRGMSALMQLARAGDVVLVLAFDQIEGTERLGEEAVSAFLTALSELFNAQGSTLIALFCQTQAWPRLRERAQVQVRDRLDDQPAVLLKALTPEQATALIEARMVQFWAGSGLTPPTPSYPFDHDLLVEIARRENLRTPRAVLNHFRSLMSGRPMIAQPREAKAMHDVLRAKLGAIAEDEARKPPRLPDARADIVQGMSREAFKAAWVAERLVAGAKVEQVESIRLRQRLLPGSRITLLRGGVRRRVYFEANNSTHGGSVAATVRRLKSVLRASLADRVLLLRESSLPLPTAARELVAQLVPHGAVQWLDDNDVAPLPTLESLLNAAAAGDIPLSEPDTRHAALELIPSLGALLDRVGNTVFDEEPERRASTVADPVTVARLRRSLRDQRSIETLPALADRLGMPAELVHAGVEALRSQGLIDVVRDRAGVHVAILRPED